MPARRRRSSIRDAASRFEMWDRKVKADTYALQLESVKPLVRGKVAQYQVAHENLISTVRNIVGAFGYEAAIMQEYMWFAQKLWSFKNHYTSEALQKQADSLFVWHVMRGRNEACLRAVAQALGIKISEWDKIIEKLMAPQLLTIIGHGTLIADGTPQTLIEYAGLTTIQGYIDLSNMQEGDTVTISIYIKVKPDGEYKLYNTETYYGKQPTPTLYILPRVTAYGYKAVLQQTAGTYKSFDYLFTKGT